MKIKQLNDKYKDEWDKYVRQHNKATVYHLTIWQQIITQCFGHDCYYLFAENSDGKICGVLPIVHINSILFGNNFYSLPFFNYGSALADNEQIKSKLVKESIKLAEAKRTDYLQIRENSKVEALDLDFSENKVNMLLQLPDTTDELGKSIGSKRRSQIKRPIREGVTHKFGKLELLDDFYEVFCINMRDLGTPVYSKSFFKKILNSLPENSLICVVYWQNKPVSAGFLLHHNSQMEIPWASTVRYANKISVNMYLYWQILSYAIEHKFKVFDFGRSTVNAGTYKFKKQWGAEPEQCYWYHWVPKGKELPNLSPSNSKFEAAIKIWQKLPLSFTKLIGPPIVKNLP